MSRADGKVAFITGAGRGIGKALALGFAREGYCVVVSSTTASRNEVVADTIRENGSDALPITLDVVDEDGVKRAVAQTLDKLGRIDVVINNAGLKSGFVPKDQPNIWDLSLPIWRRMLDVNVTGAFLCARECAQHMVAQKHGAIINVTSGAGNHPRNGIYSISKAALNMVNGVFALELKEHNVSVNALMPGGTDVREWNPGDPPLEPRPNMMKPQTSLPVALFLAEQDPIEVTGEIIDVLAWNEAHGLGGREVWASGA